MEVKIAAVTRCPSVEVKESFDDHLPIAFLDGRRSGLSSDSGLSCRCL